MKRNYSEKKFENAVLIWVSTNPKCNNSTKNNDIKELFQVENKM